jgi:hypothetical protein
MVKYWFPAKRYGWGWGFPVTWQGWSVMAAFLLLIAAGAALITPRRGLPVFLAYVAVLSIAFVGICWLKGEPPRWRWGNGKPAQH